MTFLHFVRRTHLYLGLALLPWVIMFGVTSIPINHPAAPNPPTWNRIGEVAFSAPLPAPGDDPRHAPAFRGPLRVLTCEDAHR